MDGLWDTPDLTALLTVLARNQGALERAFYGSYWQRALFRLKHWLNANSDAGEAEHRRALRPRQRLLPAVAGRVDDLLVGVFGGDASSRSSRAAGQVRADARRARAAGGCAHPRDRLRLGRLRRVAARRGLPRHGTLAVRRADRVRARTARAAGPRRPGRVPHPGLPRRTRRVRRRRVDRDVRGGRREVLADVLPPRARVAAAGRRALASRRSPSPRSASSATGRSPTSSSSTSSRAACWPRRRAWSPRRRAAGSSVVRSLRFGRDYGETLRRWLAGFEANAATIGARFDEAFVRCWRFYLAYCAAGFDSETTDVGQYTFESATSARELTSAAAAPRRRRPAARPARAP